MQLVPVDIFLTKLSNQIWETWPLDYLTAYKVIQDESNPQLGTLHVEVGKKFCITLGCIKDKVVNWLTDLHKLDECLNLLETRLDKLVPNKDKSEEIYQYLFVDKVRIFDIEDKLVGCVEFKGIKRVYELDDLDEWDEQLMALVYGDDAFYFVGGLK